MAFIGASSSAAFFFLMARRLMPFIAFAFFPPFLIALRIALRIYISTRGAPPQGFPYRPEKGRPPAGGDHGPVQARMGLGRFIPEV